MSECVSTVTIEYAYVFTEDASLAYTDAVLAKGYGYPFDDNGAEKWGNIWAITQDDAELFGVEPEDFGAKKVRAIVIRGYCFDVITEVIDTLCEFKVPIRFTVSHTDEEVIVLLE